MTAKEFFRRNRRTIVSVLIIKAAAVLWLTIPFVFKVYIAISQTVPEMQTTIDSLDKSPIEIREKVDEIEIKQREIIVRQEDLKEYVEDIKDYQKLILEKLIQIQNGD